MTNSRLTGRYDKPHRLHLETTKKCNMRCEHCYVSSDSSYAHHPVTTLMRAIAETAKKGAYRITFTGGEFLTRNDWDTLICYAIKCGFRNIYFISNGLNINKKMLSWLSRQQAQHNLRHMISILLGKEKPLTIGFGISLDGIKGYGLIRRNNVGLPVDVNKIIKKIRMATHYGIYITVNTTVSNSTIAGELYDVYKILLSAGIDRWQLDQVFQAGRGGISLAVEPHEKWFEIALENYYKIIRHHLSIYPHKTKIQLEIVQLFRTGIIESGFGPRIDDQAHPCDYQFGSIIVENGETTRFCPSLRGYLDDLFNIRNKEVCTESYLQHAGFSQFSKMTIDDLECNNCRYRYLSHGGCRANCLSSEIPLTGKDPICCKLSPFLEHRIVPLLSPALQNEFFSLLDYEGNVP